jgi:hypothetical protein
MRAVDRDVIRNVIFLKVVKHIELIQNMSPCDKIDVLGTNQEGNYSTTDFSKVILSLSLLHVRGASYLTWL